MFRLRRKKLSDAQLQKAEEYGQKVGSFFNRFVLVKKVNRYASRHRFWVLPAVVVSTFAFTLISLFLRPAGYADTDYEALMLKTERDTVNLRDACSELNSELQLRADSIEILLQKDHLSSEDSLYISSSYAYIETLNNILHAHEEAKP